MKIAFTKKAREGLLWFGPKSFVLPLAIQENKDANTQNHSFDCCVKGKEIPLQALTSPEGSRRLRLPDFKTIGT